MWCGLFSLEDHFCPGFPLRTMNVHECSQTGLASSHAFIDGDGSGEREEAGEDESEHHFILFTQQARVA